MTLPVASKASAGSAVVLALVRYEFPGRSFGHTSVVGHGSERLVDLVRQRCRELPHSAEPYRSV